ncbi:MAG: hypothetical protein LUC23_01040 [Prevotellaceae bacterium]|nr:hypothetical protein [Prevotellaceae bacterium]
MYKLTSLIQFVLMAIITALVILIAIATAVKCGISLFGVIIGAGAIASTAYMTKQLYKEMQEE